MQTNENVVYFDFNRKNYAFSQEITETLCEDDLADLSDYVDGKIELNRLDDDLAQIARKLISD